LTSKITIQKKIAVKVIKPLTNSFFCNLKGIFNQKQNSQFFSREFFSPFYANPHKKFIDHRKIYGTFAKFMV